MEFEQVDETSSHFIRLPAQDNLGAIANVLVQRSTADLGSGKLDRVFPRWSQWVKQPTETS